MSQATTPPVLLGPVAKDMSEAGRLAARFSDVQVLTLMKDLGGPFRAPVGLGGGWSRLTMSCDARRSMQCRRDFLVRFDADLPQFWPPAASCLTMQERQRLRMPGLRLRIVLWGSLESSSLTFRSRQVFLGSGVPTEGLNEPCTSLQRTPRHQSSLTPSTKSNVGDLANRGQLSGDALRMSGPLLRLLRLGFSDIHQGRLKNFTLIAERGYQISPNTGSGSAFIIIIFQCCSDGHRAWERWEHLGGDARNFELQGLESLGASGAIRIGVYFKISMKAAGLKSSWEVETLRFGLISFNLCQL